MSIVAFPQQGLEGIISSSRYEIIEEVGRGTWGVVYKARDLTFNDIVAIKVLEPTDLAREQMEHRNVTSFDAIANERWFKASAHIVPRNFEIDNDEKPFIVMPFYQTFFDKILKENNILKIGEGISQKVGLKYLQDIAKGLGEMHSTKRVHGDLKPDNIAVDGNKLLLTDLGTATNANFGWTVSAPRDNMGFLYVRAPECFVPESHPTTSSDVYSWGSLAYKLFSGEYPWKEELNEDPDLFMHVSKKELRKQIKIKVRKNVPRPFRKLVRECLDPNPNIRRYDGNEISSELEGIIKNMSLSERAIKYLKLLGWIAVPAAIGGLTTYGILTDKPTEITIPTTEIKMIINPSEYETKKIEFEGEQFDLPKINSPTLFDNVSEDYIKRRTNNLYVAYLASTYGNALPGSWIEPKTEFQNALYRVMRRDIEFSGRSVSHIDLELWPVVINSIEVAMNRCKRTEDGKLDLEDMMVMTRLGPETVLRAKMMANSENYIVYKNAKDINGKNVIPEEEIKFTDKWLAYYYSDY